MIRPRYQSPTLPPFTVRRVTVPDWTDSQDYDDGPDDDEWDEETEEEQRQQNGE